MSKNGMEVFMDEFSVFGSTFYQCLDALDRCENSNLVQNKEKYHFMVQERIVLGDKV